MKLITKIFICVMLSTIVMADHVADECKRTRCIVDEHEERIGALEKAGTVAVERAKTPHLIDANGNTIGQIVTLGYGHFSRIYTTVEASGTDHLAIITLNNAWSNSHSDVHNIFQFSVDTCDDPTMIGIGSGENNDSYNAYAERIFFQINDNLYIAEEFQDQSQIPGRFEYVGAGPGSAHCIRQFSSDAPLRYQLKGVLRDFPELHPTPWSVEMRR